MSRRHDIPSIRSNNESDKSMSTILRKKIRKNGREISIGGKILVMKVDFGLYTVAEIDALIADDYIPVATANELDGLRNAVSQTMGAGTQWEANYLTGVNKKYIQVRDIDLSSFANWNPINANNNNIIFDGNELYIKNLNIDAIVNAIGLFSDYRGIVKNVRLQGTIITTGEQIGLFAGKCGLNASFDNIICWGDLSTTTATAIVALGGLVGAASYTNNFNNCEFYGTLTAPTATGQRVGGIAGNNGGYYDNCKTDVVIYASRYGGGIEGFGNASTIKNCKTSGSINLGDRFAGGLSGRYANIEKSTSNMVVIGDYSGGLLGVSNDSDEITNSYFEGSVNGNFSGGIIGNRNAGTPIVTNCYVSGSITGSNCNAIIGSHNVDILGAVTNTYYDSENINDGAGDVFGESRTTAQMEKGFENAILDTNGNEDPTGDAIYEHWNSEYDEILEDYVPLAQAIWRFTPITQYPTLL